MFFEKIAVFDLDETLYLKNSHIEVISAYYNFCFENVFFKVIAYLFPSLYLKILNFFYNKVPFSYIESFKLDFRSSAIELLKEKRAQGYHIVIISNAPKELIEVAAKRLNVDFYRAEPNRKSEKLLNYSYDKLFVCTDNITDMDILAIANERYVYIKSEGRKKYFSKLDHVIFMEG